MGRARYLVDAMVVEGRKPSELARVHGVARSWLYKLLARFGEGGYAALEPRSRRPHHCPQQSSTEVEREVVRLRQELTQAGFDAGPQTILFHLQDHLQELPSAATVWRILTQTPQSILRPL